MSPHVGNFVQDLVEMAKATERLPGLEAELAQAKADNEAMHTAVMAREDAIIRYKAEIEDHLATIRTLEVSRDDAELRFLELDKKVHRALGDAASIRVLVEAISTELDPPQPEPVKVDIVDYAAEDLAKSYGFDDGGPYNMPGNVDQAHSDFGPIDASVGQSEADLWPSEAVSETAPLAENLVTVEPSLNAEPSPGPYFGHRYASWPSWVARYAWIEGGGDADDYDSYYATSHRSGSLA